VSLFTSILLGAFLILYALQNDGELNSHPSFFNLTLLFGILIIIYGILAQLCWCYTKFSLSREANKNKSPRSFRKKIVERLEKIVECLKKILEHLKKSTVKDGDQPQKKNQSKKPEKEEEEAEEKAEEAQATLKNFEKTRPKIKPRHLFILIGGLTTLNALSLLNSTPPPPTPVPTSITTTTHQYCAKCAEAHQQCPKSIDRPSNKNSTTSDSSCKDCCITTEKTSLSIPSSSSYLPPWFILTSGLVLLIIGGIASGERESSKK